MIFDPKRIPRDLEKMVKQCNARAEDEVFMDPLIYIGYSLEAENDGSSYRIIINRNSGGSPESDYAIEDEIKVRIEKDGMIHLTFLKEMMEVESITLSSPEPRTWEEMIRKIEEFCYHEFPGEGTFF